MSKYEDFAIFERKHMTHESRKVSRPINRFTSYYFRKKFYFCSESFLTFSMSRVHLVEKTIWF